MRCITFIIIGTLISLYCHKDASQNEDDTGNIDSGLVDVDGETDAEEEIADSAVDDIDMAIDTGEGVILSAECNEQTEPQINVLRYYCTVETSGSTEISIEYQSEAGEGIMTTETSAPGTLHEFTLYNLKAETTYDWTAKGATASYSGTFTTNALPGALADIEFNVVTACNGCGTEYVLMSYGCTSGPSGVDFMIIIDTQGNIVWYNDFSNIIGRLPKSIEVLSYTENSTLLSIIERQWIIETDLLGTNILTLQKGVTPGFDRFVHHDVTKKDNKIWAINARDSADHQYIIDGVYVINESGAIEWTWDLDGVYTPANGTTSYWTHYGLNGNDWAHSNALSINSDGSFLFSMTALHSILYINSNGTINWELKGDGSGGNFTLNGTAFPDFYNQHHVYQTTNGRIILDDTRNNHACGGSCQPARIIELELNGTHANITKVWPIGEACPTQGSGTVVGDDHMLVSCSSLNMLKEVHHNGASFWEVRLSCKSGTAHNAPIYRVAPFYF